MLPPIETPIQPFLTYPSDNYALRRKVQAELADLKCQLQGHSDEFSQGIALWLQNFNNELRKNEDVQIPLNAFIKDLREQLKDPLFPHAPLDIEAFLGKDGKIYGHKSFCVHFNLHPSLFKTSPHPLIRHLLNWLSTHNASFAPQEELEQAYKKLINPLVKDPKEKIRRIMARQAQRQQREDQAIQPYIQEIETHAQQMQVELQNFVHMQALNQETHFQKNLQQMDDFSRQEQEQMAIIKAAVDKLEKEVEELSQREKSLNEQINQVDQALTDITSDNLKLQRAIVETEKALKEQEQSGLKSLVKAVALIGIAAFTSFALSSLLPGLSLSAIPKGAKIGFSFAL